MSVEMATTCQSTHAVASPARRFSSFGVAFTIAAPASLLSDALVFERFPGTISAPNDVPDSCVSVDLAYRIALCPGTARYQLFENDRLLAEQPASTLILEDWESFLQNAIATRCNEYLFLHAAVLARGGRAILLPGESYSGKSSLAVELARQGCTYYSDEFALVDEQGLIHAYPRPVKLRRASGQAPVRLVPASLGPLPDGRPPLWAGLIVFCHYASGASWSARQLSAGESMCGLLQSTVSVRNRSAAAMQAAAKLARSVQCYRATRGESALAAPPLLALLSEQIDTYVEP